MAQYEAQCSAVGSFGYANYFKLYVILTDGEVSGNASKVNYNVYCQSSGSGSINATHLKYFNLNGQDIINQTANVNVSSPNAYIPIASGTTNWIEHNSDGSKTISFSAQIKANSYGVSATLNGTFNLVKIARYATINSFNVSNLSGVDGLTKVKFNWSADAPCDWAWYSIDNGNTWNDLKTSGIVSGLIPNTSYKFKLKIRRTDSQLTTTSNLVTKSTYDIARISNVDDIEHGNNINIMTINPANISKLDLLMKIEDVLILTRSVKTGSNEIIMTDEELDILYRQYGRGNNLTATFVLSAGGYDNSKKSSITLTGNQKTIYANGKRGKVFIGAKRGVTWQNVNGTWKRGG